MTADPRELNFFDVRPKPRDYSRPVTPEERAVLGRFGEEYFVSPFAHGYKRYDYTGAYREAARRIVEHYGLRAGSRVLEVGTARGFLLHDLKLAEPGLVVTGLDVSTWAISNAMPSVRGRLVCGSGSEIPFPDGCFDLVLCVDVLINLEPDAARRAVAEMARVSRGAGFIQTPAYRTERDLENLRNWVATAFTVRSVDEWKALYRDVGYPGDYFWLVFADAP